MNGNNNSLKSSLHKELTLVKRQEKKLLKKAGRYNRYGVGLSEKIPSKMKKALQTAFSKAFGIVLDKGSALIEKSYNKDGIVSDYQIMDFAVSTKGSRKQIRRLRNAVKKSDTVNMALTAAEGIGLGILGIGFPDVVLFTGMVLRGIYEVAMRYGYSYDTMQERFFILTLIRAALSGGADYISADAQADDFINRQSNVDILLVREQIQKASDTFAESLLVAKFIQGLPVIGIVGGVFNPVYYDKILKYARLKYYKRYLTDRLDKLS